jgi:putative heme iron utilization protein
MPNDPTYFTQLDVSASTSPSTPPPEGGEPGEVVYLLRQMLAAQDRQNELLEEMITQTQAQQKQRAGELGQWKQANPRVARQCRKAAEALSKVQTQFLGTLTEEITDSFDCLVEGDFMLNEFVDRFGPRLAHLNGVLQVLTQLGSNPEPSNTPKS